MENGEHQKKMKKDIFIELSIRPNSMLFLVFEKVPTTLLKTGRKMPNLIRIFL